eukprot:1157632-Pelagomonas_calceolata.AAC.3
MIIPTPAAQEEQGHAAAPHSRGTKHPMQGLSQPRQGASQPRQGMQAHCRGKPLTHTVKANRFGTQPKARNCQGHCLLYGQGEALGRTAKAKQGKATQQAHTRYAALQSLCLSFFILHMWMMPTQMSTSHTCVHCILQKWLLWKRRAS